MLNKSIKEHISKEIQHLDMSITTISILSMHDTSSHLGVRTCTWNFTTAYIIKKIIKSIIMQGSLFHPKINLRIRLTLSRVCVVRT